MFTKHSRSHSCNARAATFSCLDFCFAVFLFKCICLEGKWENTSRIVYAKALISLSDVFFFTFVLSFYILVEKTKLYLCQVENNLKCTIRKKTGLIRFLYLYKRAPKCTRIYTVSFTSLFLCPLMFINADTCWTCFTMHSSRCLEVLIPSFHSNLRHGVLGVLLSPLFYRWEDWGSATSTD